MVSLHTHPQNQELSKCELSGSFWRACFCSGGWYSFSTNKPGSAWCSGVPRVSCARGQRLFGRPHLARSWRHRCEEWVRSKGTSKADSSPSYGCFYTCMKTSYDCGSRSLNLGNRNYRRIKNLIFSLEALPTKISVTVEHSNCCIATFQIVVIHSNCSN